mmetsp:Transcript_6233/g.8102  ORF Transcript_6233/g.8102 Transcript_6233/m.8102 type:complete len:89 (+) Transcript_6233:99-365(+)|eukprot:CAMPEP_0198150772 /NCGR_PEP_ID=MMETSP1443-20131203/52386_1 /TAXON_ID=186043 /ORGANISM="Entomoneis sp., Strain CCMP2396" /LENGTH=88 /DNA_ID=CAMNT_0043816189 /DNA_START=95 /DNA_END=361 /DNA_ORIENTATION=+
MNALTRTVTNTLPRAIRARSVNTAALPAKFQVKSFSKNWLHDPGTYPIVAIMIIASPGWMLFLGYKIMYCPTVRISSKTKGKIIRTWS